MVLSPSKTLDSNIKQNFISYFIKVKTNILKTHEGFSWFQLIQNLQRHGLFHRVSKTEKINK